MPCNETCGHRSPLNYDHTRWATCTQPCEHEGTHSDGERVWTDRTMPWTPRATALPGNEERANG